MLEGGFGRAKNLPYFLGLKNKNVAPTINVRYDTLENICS